MTEKFFKVMLDMATESQSTPDVLDLSVFSSVPVFIWGDDKRGFSNHSILGASSLVGFGHTIGSNYKLYRSPSYPVLFRDTTLRVSEQRGVTGRIKGEVYRVSPEVIQDLDDQYDNGVFFNRVRRHISFCYLSDISKKEKVWFDSEVWMYEAIPEAFEQKIAQKKLEVGQLFRPKKNLLGSYYFYTLAEDRDVNT